MIPWTYGFMCGDVPVRVTIPYFAPGFLVAVATFVGVLP